MVKNKIRVQDILFKCKWKTLPIDLTEKKVVWFPTTWVPTERILQLKRRTDHIPFLPFHYCLVHPLYFHSTISLSLSPLPVASFCTQDNFCLEFNLYLFTRFPIILCPYPSLNPHTRPLTQRKRCWERQSPHLKTYIIIIIILTIIRYISLLQHHYSIPHFIPC